MKALVKLFLAVIAAVVITVLGWFHGVKSIISGVIDIVFAPFVGVAMFVIALFTPFEKSKEEAAAEVAAEEIARRDADWHWQAGVPQVVKPQ